MRDAKKIKWLCEIMGVRSALLAPRILSGHYFFPHLFVFSFLDITYDRTDRISQTGAPRILLLNGYFSYIYKPTVPPTIVLVRNKIHYDDPSASIIERVIVTRKITVRCSVSCVFRRSHSWGLNRGSSFPKRTLFHMAYDILVSNF